MLKKSKEALSDQSLKPIDKLRKTFQVSRENELANSLKRPWCYSLVVLVGDVSPKTISHFLTLREKSLVGRLLFLNLKDQAKIEKIMRHRIPLVSIGKYSRSERDEHGIAFDLISTLSESILLNHWSKRGFKSNLYFSKRKFDPYLIKDF